jgi:hypothetical protein
MDRARAGQGLPAHSRCDECPSGGGNALGLDLLLLDRLRDLLLIGDDVRVEPHPPLGDGLLVDDDLLHMVV